MFLISIYVIFPCPVPLPKQFSMIHFFVALHVLYNVAMHVFDIV